MGHDNADKRSDTDWSPLHLDGHLYLFILCCVTDITGNGLQSFLCILLYCLGKLKLLRQGYRHITVMVKGNKW